MNLEGFGLRDSTPEMAPERYARWIDELKKGVAPRTYDTLADVAHRLRRIHPRLTDERARFLAEHWAAAVAGGGYRIAADAAHRIVNPVLYRWAEVAACWARIECPVLWVQARETDALRWAGDQAEVEQRRSTIQRCEPVVVDDAGHMLHHDRPAEVARLIEAFIGRLA